MYMRLLSKGVRVDDRPRLTVRSVSSQIPTKVTVVGTGGVVVPTSYERTFNFRPRGVGSDYDVGGGLG